MGYHDKRLVLAFAESVNDIFHQSAVAVVEPVERLIKDKQLGVFHKCPCQKHQALLAVRHLQEAGLGLVAHAENIHPEEATRGLLLVGLHVEAHCVAQSACHNLQGFYVAVISSVHLGRHIAYVLLYVPDALSASALVAKEGDVARIALWVVGADEAQERRLARSVLSAQRPSLAVHHLP